ncbi:MAG: hypothetical protein K0Q95_2963 [Bacteroidota bacterium]|jgi:hypothetical protein|nr:hypothetical protein [Bacteroidota bacterium]
MSAGQPSYDTDPFLRKCLNTFISLCKVLLKSKFPDKFPDAETKSCILLGNGPSLKESLVKHSSFFREHPLLCLNSFSVTDEYNTLKPEYYAMLDPGLWLSKNETALKTFDAIITKTTWKVYLFIPRSAAKIPFVKELSVKNPNVQTVFFNYTVFRGFSSIGNFLFRKNLAMPQSQNVLVAAIFLTINMNFKKIYLFGADHTWHQSLHVNDENVLCIKDVHFYDSNEKISYRPFYKGMHRNDTFTVHEIFMTWAKVFSGYFTVRHYGESRDCKIYNASEISFIDAFERIKI